MQMKKIIAQILVIVMIMSVILSTAACSDTGKTNDPNDKGSDSGQGSDTEAVVKSATETISERYKDVNLEKHEYRVLAPQSGSDFYRFVSSTTNEVYYEEVSAEVMENAIYDRNLKTEELLNITITPIWRTNTNDVATTVSSEVLSGTDSFDAVLNRMDSLGSSMQSGYLLNIKNIASIDTSNPWWDKNIVDAFTLFNSKLYFISGDINIFDDYAVEALYFNKNLCDDNSLEYPYKSAAAGTWTIDEFYGMVKAVEFDVNGNGKVDIGTDIIGHIEVNDHITHWLYAMGERIVDISSDGALDLMILTERHINVIDKLFSLMVDGEMTYTGTPTNFKNGNILFMGEMLGSISSFRDMEDEFGILPMPKYDENQKNYGAYVSHGWTTAYAIPMTNKDPERTGIILEALCGYSTDTVRSALYEVLLGAKLVRDEESVQMLDLLLGSKAYEWGAGDFAWGKGFLSIYNTLYSSKSNTYVSSAEKQLKSMTKTLENLVNKIWNLEY